MEKFENLSKTEGLTPDAILEVISQIESTEINLTRKLKLMSYLIPKDYIPEEAFIRMTCLFSDKISRFLKVEILKWMISVYSFVDDLTNFLNLYDIFLDPLADKKLRPYLCHLLCKITKKEHVTFGRFLNLCELLQKSEDPYLVFLSFNLYVDKFPSFLNIHPKKDVKCDFKPLGIYPDLIKSIHPSYDSYIPTNYIPTNEEGAPLPPICIRVEKSSHVLTATHSADYKSSNEQSGVDHKFLAIYKEFENMERPTKIMRILGNKLRRLFLTSDISQRKRTSIDDFILVSMRMKLNNIRFLRDTLEIFRDMQRAVPGVSEFTEEFIEQWNGSCALDVVMELLSYEPLCCFEEIQYKLDLIHTKLVNACVYEKCEFITGLSNLYQNWVLSNAEHAPHQKNVWPLSDDNSTVSDDLSAAKQIHKLGNYIDLICDAYLLDFNFHPCLLHEILLHYEKVSRCHMTVDNLVMHPPTTSVFHAALISLNPVILESLCRLMSRYQEEVKTMKKNNNPEFKLADVYLKRYVNDILLLLLEGGYKSNVITHLSKENVFEMLKEEYPNFEEYFEVYRHPALIVKASTFMKNSNIKEVLPSKIKNNPEVHENFFNYLKQCGLEFLAKFLTVLMNERKKRLKK